MQNEIAEFKCSSVLTTLNMVAADMEPGICAYLSSLLQVRWAGWSNPALRALRFTEDAPNSLALCAVFRPQRVVFVSGDYVIRQGEFSPGMVFLSDGEVEVIADIGEEESGKRKSALITTLGPHSFFGEMSLLDGFHKSTASIRVPDFCEGWLLAVEAYHQAIA